MADAFSSLAARALGLAPVVRPSLPPRFAPEHPHRTAWVAWDDTPDAGPSGGGGPIADGPHPDPPPWVHAASAESPPAADPPVGPPADPPTPVASERAPSVPHGVTAAGPPQRPVVEDRPSQDSRPIPEGPPPVWGERVPDGVAADDPDPWHDPRAVVVAPPPSASGRPWEQRQTQDASRAAGSPVFTQEGAASQSGRTPAPVPVPPVHRPTTPALTAPTDDGTSAAYRPVEVSVSIGRVEVRTTPRADRTPRLQPAPRPAPRLSLQDYLRAERR